MKRIWTIGMVTLMLAWNCVPCQAKGEKARDGVLGAFSTFAQNSSGAAQMSGKLSTTMNKYSVTEINQKDWNEEMNEGTEKANEFIYEGETTWLNTDAGFYQVLTTIVRDIAWYYNGTYDLDLDLDHPFDRKEE